MADMSALPERAVRVSTPELFFDLVFVFTITQLTSVLVSGSDAAAALQVIVMLLIVCGSTTATPG
jgi:low temperature requirement protein LtrA